MKRLVLALALAGSVLFGLAAGSAQAAPLSAAPGAIGAAAQSMSIVDSVQYVYSGRAALLVWRAAGRARAGMCAAIAGAAATAMVVPVGWKGWAAPVVVAPAPAVVVRGPYFYSGRYYHNRRFNRGRWVYY